MEQPERSTASSAAEYRRTFPMGGLLFRSQRHDGIEACRLVRRQEAEQQAGEKCAGESQQRRLWREQNRESNPFRSYGQAQAQYNTDQPADAADNQGLGIE